MGGADHAWHCEASTEASAAKLHEAFPQ